MMDPVIVVTAPSSPDAPSPQVSASARHDPALCHPLNTLHVPSLMYPKSRFESLLDSTPLPDPGPAHYAARRKLWSSPSPSAPTQRAPPHHPAIDKILRRRGGRLDTDETWRAGLDKIWKSIVSGARLKQNMPLSYLVPILKAGWVQDGTWPRGAIVQSSDDEPLSPSQGSPDRSFSIPSTPPSTQQTPKGQPESVNS